MSRPIAARVRHATSVLLLGMSMAVTACGTAGRGASTGGPRDQITRNLIEVLAEDTAYGIIQQLRPRWLRARTQATPNNPEPAYAHVFVDELSYGGLDSLRRISANEIERIEYLDARNATIRYGTGYLGGIIRIIIR